MYHAWNRANFRGWRRHAFQYLRLPGKIPAPGGAQRVYTPAALPFCPRAYSPGQRPFIPTSTSRRPQRSFSERLCDCWVQRLEDVREEFRFLLIGSSIPRMDRLH